MANNTIPHLTCLTENEQNHPEQVITSLFDHYELKDAKEMLYEAKRIVIKKKFRFRRYSIEQDNTELFFENMEKLIEAAFLIR